MCSGSWADILCTEAKISGKKETEILERVLKALLWMERAPAEVGWKERAGVSGKSRARRARPGFAERRTEFGVPRRAFGRLFHAFDRGSTMI